MGSFCQMPATCGIPCVQKPVYTPTEASCESQNTNNCASLMDLNALCLDRNTFTNDYGKSAAAEQAAAKNLKADIAVSQGNQCAAKQTSGRVLDELVVHKLNDQCVNTQEAADCKFFNAKADVASNEAASCKAAEACNTKTVGTQESQKDIAARQAACNTNTRAARQRGYTFVY